MTEDLTDNPRSHQFHSAIRQIGSNSSEYQVENQMKTDKENMELAARLSAAVDEGSIADTKLALDEGADPTLYPHSLKEGKKYTNAIEQAGLGKQPAVLGIIMAKLGETGQNLDDVLANAQPDVAAAVKDCAMTIIS